MSDSLKNHNNSKQINERFFQVINDKSEDFASNVCIELLMVLDKLDVPSTNSNREPADRHSTPRRQPMIPHPSHAVDRGSGSSRHPLPVTGRHSHVGTIVGEVANNLHRSGSSKVRPETAPPAVVGHQTSFDRAMRERMAELVGNDMSVVPIPKFKREASVVSSTVRPNDRKATWWHLFYRSHDDDMYDMFLNFKDEDLKTTEQRLNYLIFKGSDVNIPLQMFVLCFGLTYGATRLWWPDDIHQYTTNPAAVVAVLLYFVCALLLIVIMCLRLSLISIIYDIRALQRFHPAAVRFYKSRFGQSLNNGIVVGAALAAGLHTLSQAMAGACPAGTTMLHMRDCNIGAHEHIIAPEVIGELITVVLLLQTVARGVGRLGLVSAWMIVFVCINTSLWLVGSMSYLWINLELACVIYISYELERYPLRQFIKSVRMLEASEVNTQLQIALSRYQVREGQLALEAKRSMVRHIGHEIRTPLNIIGVGTDVLLKELKQVKPRVSGVMLEVVRGIQAASGTALEVVNELLMFEKLAAGMTTVETTPTRVVRFLQKAMKQHMLPARAKEIDFTLSVDPRDGQVVVDIDPIKMIVVFRNIFSNAIKFTDQGGKIEVRVTRKASATGQELVLIACKDQGAGLSKANLKLLFGEGVQFNANKLQNGGGSGFGLYITKGIVTLHKGANIWAESEGESKGCTFFVELPLEALAPSTAENEKDFESDSSSDSDGSSVKSELPQDPLAASLNAVITAIRSKSANASVVAAPFKPRVLIVDDSAMSRRMLARMLDVEGFECYQAVDGLAAVAFVSRANLLQRYSVSGSASVCQVSRDDHITPVSALTAVGDWVSFSQGPSRRHSGMKSLAPFLAGDGARGQSEPAGTSCGEPSRWQSIANDLPPVDETQEKCTPAVVNSNGPSKQSSSAENNLHSPRQRVRFGPVLSPQQTPRQHELPDVILIDSNMPKMNGPDAIAEIRKLGYTFPIFGVTGDEDRDSFMLSGADGVMMKPVRAAELVKTIHAALRKSLNAEAPKPPPTSGAMSPRSSFPGRRVEDAATRHVHQEYAAKMEGWLAAHQSESKK